MAGPKYSIYSKLQPNRRQGDEVYDKWKRQENIDRELDIREQNQKARNAAANKTKLKDYEGESVEAWEKVNARWTNFSVDFISQAGSIFVDIQNDPTLSDAEKASQMAQVEGNPDSLITTFGAFKELTDKINADENLNELEKTEMNSELGKFIYGNFKPVMKKENGYVLEFVGPKGEDFSIQEVMDGMNKVKGDYLDKLNYNKAYNDISKTNMVSETPLMGAEKNERGRWEHKDKSVMMNYYDDLAKYRVNVGSDKWDEGRSSMYDMNYMRTNIEIEKANAIIDKANKETIDDPKSLFDYKNMHIVPDKKKKTTTYYPVISEGKTSNKTFSFRGGVDSKGNEATSAIQAKIISITYDDNLNPVSAIVASGIDAETINKFAQGNVTGLDIGEIQELTNGQAREISLIGDDNVTNLGIIQANTKLPYAKMVKNASSGVDKDNPEGLNLNKPKGNGNE